MKKLLFIIIASFLFKAEISKASNEYSSLNECLNVDLSILKSETEKYCAQKEYDECLKENNNDDEYCESDIESDYYRGVSYEMCFQEMKDEAVGHHRQYCFMTYEDIESELHPEVLKVAKKIFEAIKNIK